MKIQTERLHQGDRRKSGSGFIKAKPLIAGVTTFALGLSGALLTAGAAHAAPGSGEATARYLSGTLLERSLDDVVALQGETALANTDTEEVVTESGDLELSVLGSLLNLQVADGVEIPLTVTDAGVVGQYAQATQTGEARAASGAITSDGIIDVDPGGPAGGALTLDLTQLIGDDLADEVANLTLSTGVNSASAEKLGTDPATGDYAIAELTTTLTSPVIADLSGALLAAGDDVEATVDGLLGPDGSLVDELTTTLSGLGLAEVDAAVALDLEPVLADLLGANEVLGVDGPVQVNLLTGEVIVDIAAVLEANGRDLNALEPGEEILSTELVGFITAEVDELVNGLLQEAQEAVATTLESAVVTVDATVGLPDAPLLSLALDSSLGAISAGEAVSDIELIGITFDTALLNGLITAAVDDVLALEVNVEALDLTLDGLYPALDSVLTSLVSLQGNVQEEDADVFTQTGLRLSVLNFTDAGEALTLNLAQAAVGPTALPTDEEPTGTFVFTPTTGPEAGGTPVVFTGVDFTDVTNVYFGEEAAASLLVVSDTEMLATTPAGVGSVPVTVERGTALEAATAPFVYTATPPEEVTPAVLSITPAAGPEAGGTDVIITGTGFTGSTEVLFGDNTATDFTVISDNEIAATTPAGVGLVDVTVAKSDTVAGTLEDAFTYIPEGDGDEAFIVGINPASGPEAGDTAVSIVGSGFTEAESVFFGDNSATQVIIISDNEIIAVTPAGTGEVAVTIDGGAFADPIVSPVNFTYVPGEVTPPGETPGVITTVTPTSGPEAGGTVVTIGGEGFTGATDVTFGDNSATEYVVVSDTEIMATTPAGVGTVVVTVVDTTSNGDIVSPIGFTYVPAEAPGEGVVVDEVTPGTGPTNGGTVVVIIGGGFTDVDNVYFGNEPATNFEVISDSEIRATTPEGAPGAVDVRVVNTDGSEGTLTDGFRYIATPLDDNGVPVNGNGGSQAGGTPSASGRTDRLVSTGAEGVGGTLALAGLMLLAGLGTVIARRKGLFA